MSTASVAQDEVHAQDSRAARAEAALAAAQAARTKLQAHWTDHRRGAPADLAAHFRCR